MTTGLPRVVIDARMVGPAQHGMARYTGFLARGLSELKGRETLPYEPVFLVRPGVEKFTDFETVEVRAPFLHPSEFWELPRVLSRTGAVLYHSTTFSSLLRCPCPWISTVHDLNHLHFGGLKQRIYYRRVLRPFARRAEALLTVSEFSRRELAAWTGRDANEIEVVPNALDPALARPIPDEEVAAALSGYKLTRGEYFFCLSNPKAHKNVERLVDAYTTFRGQVPATAALPLVLALGAAGRDAFSGVEGVIHLGPVGEPEARALLTGAGGAFFPSLYEGFGLPPAEAAALGSALFVSRIPPHEEGLSSLAKDEVYWVEPTDLNGWVTAFHRARKREVHRPAPESRTRLVERFAITALGGHMDRIYRRVLGLGRGSGTK